MSRKWLLGLLLLSVALAACASPATDAAPTPTSPSLLDSPAATTPADTPAASDAAPTLIYFHATW